MDATTDNPEILAIEVTLRDSAIEFKEAKLAGVNERINQLTDKTKSLENDLHREKSQGISKRLVDMIIQLQEQVQQAKTVSDLFPIQKTFEKLKIKFSSEYQQYQLWNIIIPILHEYLQPYLSSNWNIIIPILHEYLQPYLSSNWNIIIEKDNDDDLIKLFFKWKNVLQDNTTHTDPYYQFVLDIWVPLIEESIRQWNSRESNGDRLIKLIKRWEICLPEVLLDKILGQLILPKLQYEVESFNPESDSKSIYDLLNKWSSLFKDHLELLFESIQKKSAERL